MGDTGPGQLTRLGPRLVIPKRQTDPAMRGCERVRSVSTLALRR